MDCLACGLPNPRDASTCAACGARLSLPADGLQLIMATATASPFPGAIAVDEVASETVDRPARPADDPLLYRSVPGPVDRESFFDAQRRHRRATWRLSAACGLGAVVTGVPLSLVLTPIVFAALLILTRILDVVIPVPDTVWSGYERIGLVVGEVVEALDDPSTPDVAEGDISRVPRQLLLVAGLIWVLPGMLFMLALWPALRRVFRQAGAGGVLLSLGARAPRPTDLEERQLVNVIEEMAIAAGLPPPRVMLIDADVANAATVGSSPQDATIVVSRALLDDLDRDETQGVLGHLVASIGNGDLGGAMSLIAIFQTFGFASALVKAPISGSARRMVARMARLVFAHRRSHDAVQEARAVSDLLTGGLWDAEEDDFEWVNESATPPAERPGLSFDAVKFAPYLAFAVFVGGLVLESFGLVPEGTRNLPLLLLVAGVIWLTWRQREYAAWRIRRAGAWVRVILLLPYYIVAMVPQILLMILIPFMLEPVISLLWRSRRYLADATAVQLTRNPDGLADGLSNVVHRGGVVPGGAWAAPLFVVGGSYAATAGGTFSGGSSPIVSFHPPLAKRLQRLRAMGASPADPVSGRLPRGGRLSSGAAAIFAMPLVIVLLGIATVLMVVVVALLLAISVVACGFLMAVVWGVFSVLFGP